MNFIFLFLQSESDKANLVKQLEEVRSRLESDKLGYEAERDSNQNMLDMTNSLALQKDKEIEQYKVEVS